jgi:hypothetical protein
MISVTYAEYFSMFLVEILDLYASFIPLFRHTVLIDDD